MKKERRSWHLLFAVLALVALLAAAGCGDDDDEEGGNGAPKQRQEFAANTTMNMLQEEGEITIGVKYDVPPFGVRNPRTRDIEGFDVDLGKAIADELGVKPKFIEAISDNRIPFLEKGTADLILSTMTINEERVTQIEFSDPYFIAKGRILVKSDNTEITGVDTLADRKSTRLNSSHANISYAVFC